MKRSICTCKVLSTFKPISSVSLLDITAVFFVIVQSQSRGGVGPPELATTKMNEKLLPPDHLELFGLTY